MLRERERKEWKENLLQYFFYKILGWHRSSHAFERGKRRWGGVKVESASEANNGIVLREREREGRRWETCLKCIVHGFMRWHRSGHALEGDRWEVMKQERCDRLFWQAWNGCYYWLLGRRLVKSRLGRMETLDATMEGGERAEDREEEREAGRGHEEAPIFEGSEGKGGSRLAMREQEWKVVVNCVVV